MGGLSRLRLASLLLISLSLLVVAYAQTPEMLVMGSQYSPPARLMVLANTSVVGPTPTPVRITLVNLGGRADNVTLYIYSAVNLRVRVAGPTRWSSIPGGGNASTTLILEPLALGQAALQLLVRYVDHSSGEAVVEPARLVFTAVAGQARLVAMVVSGAAGVKPSRITVAVVNVGNVPARSVEAAVIGATGLKILESSTVRAPVLPPGGEARLVAVVEAPSTRLTSPPTLEVRVAWSTATGRIAEVLTVPVPVEPPRPPVVVVANVTGSKVVPGACSVVEAVLRVAAGSVAVGNLSITAVARPPVIVEWVKPRSIAELKPGSKLLLEVNVCAPATAPPSTTAVQLILLGSAAGQPYTQTLEVPVTVVDARPRVTARIEPPTVTMKGGCSTVRLVVRNIGSAPAVIASAAVQPTQFISAQLLGSLPAELKPGGEASVPLKLCVESYPPQPTAVPVAVTMQIVGGGATQPVQATATVRIEPPPQPSISVACYPSVVEPGRIKLRIIVAATERLRDVAVAAASQVLGLAASLSAANTSRVVVNATGVAPIQLDGSSAPVQVTVRYVDELGRPGAYTGGCSVTVAGKPRLVPVSITVSPRRLSPGSVGAVSIILANQGTGRAQQIVARLDASPLIGVGETSVYLGLLQPGQTNVLSFTFKAPEGIRPGVYTPRVILTYYDSLHRGHTEVLTFTVKVTNISSTANTTLASPRAAAGASVSEVLIVVGLVVAVGVALLVVAVRRS